MKRHETIAGLNDKLRKEGVGGQVFASREVAALADDIKQQVFAAVRNFDDFNKDNDPYGEHDFAALTVAGHRINFKIDYYDKAMRYASDDPADPSVTERVMTVMMASEY